MRWLHISDIHYNLEHGGVNTKMLVKKLPQYLREQNMQADHVFVTGDFRHAKYQQDDEARVAQTAVDFILELSHAVGVEDVANIHVIPGNHDLSRCTTERDIERLHKIQRQHSESDGPIMEDDQAYLLARFSFFIMWKKPYMVQIQNPGRFHQIPFMHIGHLMRLTCFI